MDDPYKDPATGLLRNLLGHTDPVALAASEADISAAELVLLRLRTLPGDYDLRHLQRFHQRIFRSIYPWAGEIRTVAIAKTDLFCLPQHIRPYADSVFSELAAEKHLRELPRDRFVDRLTHFYAEVNAIHPFREGNGRTQRAFFGQLSRAAGWPLAWANMDGEQNVTASIASLRGDNGPLHEMLDGLVAEEG
jgi:cell filamentation protein